LGAAAVALVGLAAATCDGSSDGSVILKVTVEYPIESVRAGVSSVHFWVLEPRYSDVLDGGCGWLVTKETDPYDSRYDRHADFVSAEPGATTGTSGPVPRRYALVYAEAVDYAGLVQWSGCAELGRGGHPAYLTIRLGTPGAYDCTDREVEDYALCDDGLYCTVDEVCVDGECTYGAPRSCAYLTGVCQVGVCDETVGCHLEQSMTGTYCEDGDFCTTGDQCHDGECLPGWPTDCSYLDNQCQQGVCDELHDFCMGVPNGELECDDGSYCTVDDACEQGLCVGQTVDCSCADDACSVGYCNESLLGGCDRWWANEGGLCDTNCTTGGRCHDGLCEGGTPTGVSETEGPAGDPTCADFVDNDCDTLFDGDDPDCAPAG